MKVVRLLIGVLAVHACAGNRRLWPHTLALTLLMALCLSAPRFELKVWRSFPSHLDTDTERTPEDVRMRDEPQRMSYMYRLTSGIVLCLNTSSDQWELHLTLDGLSDIWDKLIMFCGFWVRGWEALLIMIWLMRTNTRWWLGLCSHGGGQSATVITLSSEHILGLIDLFTLRSLCSKSWSNEIWFNYIRSDLDNIYLQCEHSLIVAEVYDIIIWVLT